MEGNCGRTQRARWGRDSSSSYRFSSSFCDITAREAMLPDLPNGQAPNSDWLPDSQVSARGHPEGAVQPVDLAVQISILNAVQNQLRKLSRPAQAFWERNGRAQGVLHFRGQ